MSSEETKEETHNQLGPKTQHFTYRIIEYIIGEFIRKKIEYSEITAMSLYNPDAY